MSGYLGEAPLSSGQGFVTSDRGFLDETGQLHVVGRVAELIVSGGENVYPAEVESVIEQIPGVVRAVVFGLPDSEWGERVAAAIIREPGTTISQDAFEQCLAPFQRPRQLFWIDQIPLLPGGKTDRRAVRDACISRGAPDGI